MGYRVTERPSRGRTHHGIIVKRHELSHGTAPTIKDLVEAVVREAGYLCRGPAFGRVVIQVVVDPVLTQSSQMSNHIAHTPARTGRNRTVGVTREHYSLDPISNGKIRADVHYNILTSLLDSPSTSPRRQAALDQTLHSDSRFDRPRVRRCQVQFVAGE